MEWPLFMGLGALAGLVAGLLGVGGGLIIVPALVIILPKLGVQDHVAHLAVGTSLVSIVFTSLSSVWAHHKRGAVQWPVVSKLAPGIVMGALIGAGIASRLPSVVLQRIFGFLELYVAFQLTMNFKPKPHRVLPGPKGMFAVGNVIGMLSAIVGIGGGTITVPFLVWSNVKMQKAVATSAACGLPIALAGGAGFILSGLRQGGLPPQSFGYVYGPALIGIVATSVLFAPIGADLAHRLPSKHLKRVFALVLLILAARMLY